MDAARVARLNRAEPAEVREVALWCGGLACILVAAALTSTAEDWQPISLVLALGAMMILADVLPVTARRIRRAPRVVRR